LTDQDRLSRLLRTVPIIRRLGMRVNRPVALLSVAAVGAAGHLWMFKSPHPDPSREGHPDPL